MYFTEAKIMNIYHEQTAYHMVKFIAIQNNKSNSFNQIWDQHNCYLIEGND